MKDGNVVMNSDIEKYQYAENIIKTAIHQSQERIVKAANQEQLALYL